MTSETGGASPDGRAWHVELSRPAIASLRRLPRETQRAIAARIGQMERGGLPPRAPDGEPIEVPAGDHVLVCVADAEAGAIVVVTLRATEAPAARAVGGIVGRRLRAAMGGGGMEGVVKDIAYALRTLARAPGFALTAVLTLALGIGATSAIFSVARGVLLEPLPYGDADRVVTLWSQWSGFPKTWLSLEEYVYYVQESRTLDEATLYFTSSHNFTSRDDPERVGSAVLTANFLSVLGVSPQLGRAFTEEEARDEVPVVMLGHDVWQRRFLGDRSIVGRDVEINGQLFTVLGILPEGFVLPVDYGSTSPSEIFFALPVDVEAPVQVPPNGGSHGYYGIARLAEGATTASARADLEGLIGRLETEGVYQEERNFRPLVLAAKDDIVGTARGTILILLAACGFVLLIACGNVANLMLSRSEGRLREVAVRRALGAGRARIARQLLTESALISGAAGAIGLLLAHGGIDLLLAIDPASVPRSEGIGLDGWVVAFTVAVSAATAVLFGWIPAARVSAAGVGSALHDAGRGAGGGARGNRVQGLLVASQMAMAVVLLAGASLMMRTFVGLQRIEPGFTAENVLTMRLTAPSTTYPRREDVVAFYDELLRRVRELPGVRAAGATRLLPLASQMGDSGFRVIGYEPAPGESTAAEWQYVTPGYTEVMGIPLLRGRSFDERDGMDGQVTMLVNETAAKRFWTDGDPIGTRVATFGADTAVVVGVVGDLRHNGITAEVKPRYYRALAQIGGPGNIRRMTLTIQAEDDPAALVGAVRGVVRSLDPSMPVSEVRTMDEVLSSSVAQPRFAMTLLLAFAGIAVTLSVVGVYGVLAYVVSRRTQEIGIRMALGAGTGSVVGMVVRQGMGMALLGVGVGTVLALGLTGSMEAMLYEVAPRDPATFVAVPALFAVVALLASWVPAVRAARVEPTEALRYE